MFDSLHANVVSIGVVLAAATSVQTIFSYILNCLSSKINHWHSVFVGHVLSVVGFIALPFCTDFWITILPDSLILIGYAMSVESVTVLIAQKAEENMSGPKAYILMYTVYMAVANLGCTTGGLYAGPVADEVGFNMTSWMTGGMSLVFSVMLVIYLSRGCFKYSNHNR